MILNTDRLNAFFQTAKDKNFNRAANSLCITQSALSQRVLKLEQELKATLLIRDSKGIKMTEAGTLLFNYILKQEGSENELINSIMGRASQNSGILRIASFSSVLRSVIMPSIQPLIKSSSEVYVEFFSRELRELPSMLESGEVDFIVSDGSVSSPNFEAITIGQETLVHIRSRNAYKSNKSSDKVIFLDHDAEDMTTFNFFEAQGLQKKDIIRHFYDDVYGLLDGVKLGFGEAIISEHIIVKGTPVEIIRHTTSVNSSVVLYYRKNRYISPLLKKVIRLLKENASSHLMSHSQEITSLE